MFTKENIDDSEQDGILVVYNMPRTNKIPTEVGRWLLSELEARRMSQRELCRRGCLSPSQLNQFIYGEKNAGKKTYNAIAVGLGISVEEIMRKTGDLQNVVIFDDWEDWMRFLGRMTDEERKKYKDVGHTLFGSE